ncbi:hypothetical protein D3C80_1493230 [compost metagenome]
MVLQVLAHAGQIVHQIDVQAVQQRRWTNAGTLQNLRRGNRAGTQQHFTTRSGTVDLVTFALQVINAHSTLTLEADAVGQRVSDNLQV